MDLAGPLSSPQGATGGGARKAPSGVSADDISVVASLDSDLARLTVAPPTALKRRRMVVLHLDSDYALPEVTSAARALLDTLRAGGAQDVGLGLLSMLGFDSTHQHMEVRVPSGWSAAAAARLLLLPDRQLSCCTPCPPAPPRPPRLSSLQAAGLPRHVFDFMVCNRRGGEGPCSCVSVCECQACACWLAVLPLRPPPAH